MKIIPLQYLAYFPAAVFLHKVTGAELAWGLAVEAFWVVFFYLLGPDDVPLRRAARQRLRRLSRMGRIAAYLRVFLTFARNSLVRDMTFRGNFLIDADQLDGLDVLNLAFYLLVFRYTEFDRQGPGWGQYQFYVFFATGLVINSLVQTFFMTNIDELTDLIRTGGLDFILLKPIDTQFLVSLRRIEWSSLSNLVAGLVILGYSLVHLAYCPGRCRSCSTGLRGLRRGDLLQPDDHPGGVDGLDGPQPDALRFLVLHHHLFALPDGDLHRAVGRPLRSLFTFVIPVLIVVNVPARMLVWPLEGQHWPLAGFAILAAAACLAASRWLFQLALASYRSASS